MKYNIRQARKEDVKQMNELFAITVQDTFKKEGIKDPLNVSANEEIMALQQNLKRHFTAENKNSIFLVASFQHKILATIAYGSPSHLIYENVKIDTIEMPEIKSVYVLPAYQRQGIGTLLLEKMLVVLKENNIKNFCLDSGYKNAQHYWSKRLGKPTRILTDYWSKENHHYIWLCEVEKILQYQLVKNKFSSNLAH